MANNPFAVANNKFNYQNEGQPVTEEHYNNSEAPEAPAPAAPPPAAPPRPRISSHWGNSDPRGVEDMWFQYINSAGLTQGSAGNGAYKGGGNYRGKLGDVVKGFNEATGMNARVADGHDDMIDFGYGKQDVLKAGSNDWWLGARGGVEPPGGGGTGAPGRMPGGPGMPGGAPPPGAPGGPPPPGVSAELYDMLLKRAKQGTAIDRNDPNLRQQIDPYNAAVERQRRNYLADTAEKSGPLANLQGEQRMSAERAGQASGLFESQLIGRELQSRRDEITHALDSLGNRLTEDQRLALQRELGLLEDATRRYGIDADSRIATDRLGLDRDRLGLDYDEFDWRTDPRNPYNIPNFNGN